MSDLMNIVYNGDLSEGTKCWSGTGLTVSNSVLTVTGNLYHDHLIPISSTDTYEITFDYKVNTTGATSYFYIALHPYDSEKRFIGINTTNKRANTETTLATALNNGDTTVTLTSSANWDTSTNQYKRVGICNNSAWGYNRNTVNAKYASISGNVVALNSAWTGGAIPVGTKVANFHDDNAYCYPYIIRHNDLPTEWKTYTATFRGGDSMRYSCQYFKFCTLGGSNNYSMRNIRMVNKTNYQACETPYVTPDLTPSGVFSGVFNTTGRRIRYIKDSINGNNVNTVNHWVELQAYNYLGNNIAFNKYSWASDNTTKVKDCLTDGSTATSPYLGKAGNVYVVVDLGFRELITSIKVWHYWGDGRTYNDHEISVSEDGTTWYTVYKGTHPETSEGFEVILQPDKFSIQNTGIIECRDIIEI